MGIDLENNVEKLSQEVLIVTDGIPDRDPGNVARAIQLTNETIQKLAVPQEVLEKVLKAITTTLHEDESDRSTVGGILLHITISEIGMKTGGTGVDEQRNNWGMFLVRHIETDSENRTRLLVDLRLYHEIH